MGLAAVVAVPALAGCHTSPGAAAIIGGNRITVGQLQHVVSADLADSNVSAALSNPQYSATLGGSQAGFVRVTLARMVSERVLDRLAAAHHVTVSPAEVASQTATFVQEAGTMSALRMQAAQQVGVNPAQLPDLIRFTVLQQKLSQALVDSVPISRSQLMAEYQKDIDTYDQVDLAQITVKSKSLADSLAARARAHPGTFGALAKQYSTDTETKSNGGKIGFIGRNQLASVLGSDPSKIAKGQILVTHGSTGYVIVHVIATKKTSFAAAQSQLRSSIEQNEAQTLLTTAAVAESKKLGVSVSPRYGTWSPKTQTILAIKSQISAG